MNYFFKDIFRSSADEEIAVEDCLQSHWEWLLFLL